MRVLRGIECELKLAVTPSHARQDKVHTEATNYAVENIPRYNEELEAADEDDDLLGKIVEDESADPAQGVPSVC